MHKPCGTRHWSRQHCPKQYAAPNPGGLPTRAKAVLTPGEPCPTCGRVVAKHRDNAARQRAYRKRKEGRDDDD